MNLVIKKSQKKGMMGGATLEVHGQVQISPEERRLVGHYNLIDEELLQNPVVHLFTKWPTDVMIDARVRHLVSGTALKCKSVGEVSGLVDGLKSACQNLRGYPTVAGGLAGEEAHDL